MTQSSNRRVQPLAMAAPLRGSSALPAHVAIVMDGNGRWATRRGLARLEGHRRGAVAVRRAVEAARELGIGTLSLFAFAAGNWRRPRSETDGLMALFGAYLEEQTPRCVRHGIRLRVIGRRDRLGEALAASVARAERLTAGGQAMTLRLAIDYSGREAILRAVDHMAQASRGPEPATAACFARALGEIEGEAAAAPDVDLLIRTGGELRLSDFFLWEAAYAEMIFLDMAWPDFTKRDLAAALEAYASRERRFGALV